MNKGVINIGVNIAHKAGTDGSNGWSRLGDVVESVDGPIGSVTGAVTISTTYSVQKFLKDSKTKNMTLLLCANTYFTHNVSYGNKV